MYVLCRHERWQRVRDRLHNRPGSDGPTGFDHPTCRTFARSTTAIAVDISEDARYRAPTFEAAPVPPRSAPVDTRFRSAPARTGTRRGLEAPPPRGPSSRHSRRTPSVPTGPSRNNARRRRRFRARSRRCRRRPPDSRRRLGMQTAVTVPFGEVGDPRELDRLHQHSAVVTPFLEESRHRLAVLVDGSPVGSPNQASRRSRSSGSRRSSSRTNSRSSSAEASAAPRRWPRRRRPVDRLRLPPSLGSRQPVLPDDHGIDLYGIEQSHGSRW